MLDENYNFDFFKANREKLKRDIKDYQMIVLCSGKEKYFSGDSSYKFRVNKNFYYYTGLNYDDITYMIVKGKDRIVEKVFFDEVELDKVKWTGEKLTKEEAMKIFDTVPKENFYYAKDIVKQLKKDVSIHDTKEIFLDVLENEEDPLKPDLTHMDNALASYIYKATGERSDLVFKNVSEISKLHRPFKEEYEVSCIKKAIDITSRAIHMVMKNIKTCKTENEIEAYLDFSTKKDGVKNVGFYPIVASGINGTCLHYTDNNSKLEKGDLVLLDIGYEYENYSSDVSRTLPITGVFDDYQKMIYNIVLDTNKKIINDIKIGMTFKELNEKAKSYLSSALIEKGIIKEEKELGEYYFHSVSHPLGLDTHDLRPYQNTIEENMIITVEPGLYIKEDKTGIRIEDDVLVTKEGNIVLTDKIPKEISEIEKIINEK